jgi:hypothetical protein
MKAGAAVTILALSALTCTTAWLAVALRAEAAQPVAELAATSANVSEPGTPVKIRILRWSRDDERAPLVAALSPAPATALPADAARGPNAAPAAGGRGAAGRGRGRGRGGAAPQLSPIAAFTAALGRAPTLGYIWTNEVTGYSIKYAWHSPLPDGTDRIVLASDRRLGAYTNAWKGTAAAPDTDYTFTLIELRAGPKGTLEGKTSLTNKIAVDNDAKTVALENYSTIPTTLRR